MNTSRKLAIALTTAVLTLTAGASTAPPDRPQLADFKIHVQATKDGIEMVCERGCAWKELNFGCDGSVPCGSWVDAGGMTRGAAQR